MRRRRRHRFPTIVGIWRWVKSPIPMPMWWVALITAALLVQAVTSFLTLRKPDHPVMVCYPLGNVLVCGSVEEPLPSAPKERV